VRGPSRPDKGTARSYNKGGRASHHLRRRAQRSMLRHARVIRRAAPRVVPARSSATSWTEDMIPLSSLGLARTSPLRRCFCAAFQSWSTSRSRRSTGTFGRWWKPPPSNRQRAPRRDTDLWPLSPLGGRGCTKRIAPSARCYSHRARNRRLQLHHDLTQHLPHTGRLCTSTSGQTEMLAASSTTGVRPGMTMTSTGQR